MMRVDLVPPPRIVLIIIFVLLIPAPVIEHAPFDSEVLQAAIAAKKVIASKIEGCIKRLDRDQKRTIDCK